ncbi:uncharacterized protein LOC126567459 [Anopheles maculipalpis]|uniref:uncharacterized protein LOC126567459 n=1 Tax=Anopheles maculipalpis TaxID=1496333 RepID=UPI0021596025|nr:uncharacterized protein LOC126567459 [Anopheles maculipalpis]
MASSQLTTLAILLKSDKGRSTIHGDSYHLRVAMVIILRAYRMYQQDSEFCFTVAVEVAAAGKFDDILYHFSSPNLGTGTIFIQAKHKQLIGRVGALCTAWDSNASFSIPMYFLSFLDIGQQLPNDARYILCTNAGLDKYIESYFTIINPRKDNSLLFCEDIGATCYQFSRDKPFPLLIDTLRDSCLAKLGKVFAGTIFAGKEVTFNDTLVNTFDSLISQCLEPLNEVPGDKSVITFRFSENFVNADEITPIGKFRAAFQKEYALLFMKGKLKPNGKTFQELEIKFDRDLLLLAKNTQHNEIFGKFDQKVLEFYDKFLLVCNSSNEEDLRTQAMSLLPRWCDTERGTVFDKLQGVLLDALKSLYPVPLDLEFIQKCFLNIELKQSITSLRSFSGEYLKSLHLKYILVDVDPERLKRSSLYAFLEDKSGCLVYEFNSTLDSTVTSFILQQALSLFNFETLFVDSAKYEVEQDMMETLRDLLSYLKDVNHPTIKVITILGKSERVPVNETKNLSEKFGQKIIVMKKVSRTSFSDETLEVFAVKDLSHEASKQLYKETHRTMFGTVCSLSGIVDETDDLSFLLEVLKLSDHTSEVKDHNLNVYNYGKIKHWYIHRHIVAYKSDRMEEENSFHRFYPSKKEVECALVSHNEEPNPPGIDVGTNEKVHIFLNDAGHGKTSYFTWLAWRLSGYDRSLYVIKFVANEYSTDFERLEGSDIQNFDDTAIVRLLYRYTHLALFVPNVNKRTIKETDINREEADRCAKLLTVSNGQIVLDKALEKQLSTIELFELRLFREKFNEQRLVLILDGFDEIAPYYKDVVMDCFARFVRLGGVRSLYLPSRPYGFEEDLRATFTKCLMYQLEPFSRQNIILFLYKFLVNDLDDYKSWERAHRIDILRALFYSIIEDMTNALNVPLLLHMVQVILLPEIKKRVSKYTHTLSPNMFKNLKLGTFQLVQLFITRKIEILITDKTGTTDSAVKTAAAKKNQERLNKFIREQHMLLAVCVIFDRKDREKLLSSVEHERVREAMEEVLKGDEKTGFVLGVQNERPQFLHRIFAEFFTACWLASNRARFRRENIFQSQSFWSRSLRQTRKFFDCIISKESEGCDFHWALVNDSLAQVGEMMREKAFLVAVKDKVGRLPLHLVEYFQTIKILEKMPVELVNETDELFGWNALDYAFVLNERSAIRCLLKKGVKLNADTAVFLQLCANDSDELLKQGISYVSYLEKYGNQTDSANELSERVARCIINERMENIYYSRIKLNSLSMLEYCVQENNVLMLNHIIRQTALVGCAKCAVEKNQVKLFRKIFHELCIRLKILCVKEEDITDECDVQWEGETVEFQILIEYCCCSKGFEYQEQFNLFQKFDEFDLECFLANVIHVGSACLTSYILQKTKMNVTKALVRKLMKLIPFFQRSNHNNSIPAFKCLLNNMLDLHHVDQDGQTLLDTIIQDGCLYMIPCLIDKGFNPKQINVKHFIGLLTDFGQYYAINLFVYLQQKSYVNFFETLETTQNSIFDIIIFKRHFLISQALIHVAM